MEVHFFFSTWAPSVLFKSIPGCTSLMVERRNSVRRVLMSAHDSYTFIPILSFWLLLLLLLKVVNGADCSICKCTWIPVTACSCFWQHTLLFALPVIQNLCPLHFFSSSVIVLWPHLRSLAGLEDGASRRVCRCSEHTAHLAGVSPRRKEAHRAWVLHVLGSINTLDPFESVTSGQTLPWQQHKHRHPCVNWVTRAARCLTP